MKVIIIGSGGSIPHKNRGAPAQVIKNKNEIFLIDCGPGTGHSLAKLDLSLGNVKNLFLTHTHLDHCLELPLVILAGYLQGREEPINIYGPPGTNSVFEALMLSAYKFENKVIHSVAGEKAKVNVVEVHDNDSIALDNFEIRISEVNHNFPCVAYRFDSIEGHSVTISGDTKPCNSVINLSKNSRLLLHDCSLPDELKDFAESIFHSTPSQVGEIAQKANVEAVVLTHLFPDCDGKEDDMVKSVRSKFYGEVHLASDLQIIEL